MDVAHYVKVGQEEEEGVVDCGFLEMNSTVFNPDFQIDGGCQTSFQSCCYSASGSLPWSGGDLARREW